MREWDWILSCFAPVIRREATALHDPAKTMSDRAVYALEVR